MKAHKTILTAITALLLAATIPVLAQEPPEPGTGPMGRGPGDEEVREAIHKLFQTRLRAELQLTDQQMEAIGPRLMELEEIRSTLRRERHHAMRALRRGLRDGMGDADLQKHLDRLDEIQRKEIEETATHMAAVDEHLSVRQRVQLRFFVERFRQRMHERIRQIRGGEGRGPGRRGGRGPGRPGGGPGGWDRP